MPYDIAVNITDCQYLGEYNKEKKHQCDIDSVIKRGKVSQVKMVFLGTSLSNSVESIALGNEYEEYSVIGIHPGSTEESTEEDIQQIKTILNTKSISAQKDRIRKDILSLVSNESLNNTKSIIGIGEIGLDYYRTYSSKERQKEVFTKLLEETVGYNLPYIFHYRECQEDFFRIISKYNVQGVIHSYTGSAEEMKQLVSKGFYIGINGASIRENEKTRIIEEVPLDRLLLETDAPWCSIRKTSNYSSAVGAYLKVNKKWVENEGVKGRNEPVNLFEVIDVICYIRSISAVQLIEITDKNFKKLFKIDR